MRTILSSLTLFLLLLFCEEFQYLRAADEFEEKILFDYSNLTTEQPQSRPPYGIEKPDRKNVFHVWKDHTEIKYQNSIPGSLVGDVSEYGEVVFRYKCNKDTLLILQILFDGKAQLTYPLANQPGTDEWQEFIFPILGRSFTFWGTISTEKKGFVKQDFFLQSIRLRRRKEPEKSRIAALETPILIPQVKHALFRQDQILEIGKNSMIEASSELKNIQKDLCDHLQKTDAGKGTRIRLILSPDSSHPLLKQNGLVLPENQEGYVIHIQKPDILLASRSVCGVNWAFQTLKQLFVEKNGTLQVSGCEISDYPDLRHRGMGGASDLNTVKANLDYKINVTHSAEFDPENNWCKVSPSYQERMKRGIQYAKGRGADVNVWISGYRGSNRFIMKDRRALEEFCSTLRTYLKEGAGSYTIGFDDPSRGCFPEEVRGLYSSQWEYQASIVREIVKALERDFPASRPFVVTTWYEGGWEAGKPYREAGVPRKVAPMWTGPRVATLNFYPHEVEKYEKEIEGRSFLLFDNTTAQALGGEGARPGFTLFEPYAEGYGALLRSKQFLGVHLLNSCAPDSEIRKVRSLEQADFMWNAKNYDPIRSRDLALAKIAGSKEAVSLLLEFRFHILNCIPLLAPERYRKKENRKIPEETIVALRKGDYSRLNGHLEKAADALERVKTLMRNEKLELELRELRQNMKSVLDIAEKKRLEQEKLIQENGSLPEQYLDQLINQN